MVNQNYTPSAGSRRTGAVALVLALLLGGIAFYVYHSTRPRPAMVERRDIAGFVALRGVAVAPPSAIAEVHAAYSAPVDKVLTTLGAYVNRGDVLVQLAD